MAFENYYLYCLGIWLVARLPLRLTYWAAGLLAELNSFIDQRARRGAYANQGHVNPTTTNWWQRWRVVYAVFRNFGYTVVDFFRMPQINRTNADQFIAEIRGFHQRKGTAEKL